MLKEIFLTIIHLITSPQPAWKDIASQEEDHQEFLNRFLFPVFGIIALTSFIGGLWFTRDGSLEIALKRTIVNVVTVYGGYFIASYILNETAPRFGLEKHLFTYQRFVGYSSVVLYALYMILPFLSDFFILWLFAIYTFYIVYVGTEKYFGLPDDRTMNFSVLATLLVLVVPGAINAVLMFLVK
ncbi:MAG: Yip1 family protein [Petrimonas sp.]|nr:Yip1 family protein [Petrimonas sp.]